MPNQKDEEQLLHFEFKVIQKIYTIENVIADLERDKIQNVKLINRGVNLILAFYSSLFSNCKNPLYAWKAYQICRKYNRAIDPWILEYFDNTADELLKIESKKNDSGIKQIPIALKIDDIHISRVMRNKNKLQAHEMVEKKRIEKKWGEKTYIFSEVGDELLGQKEDIDKDHHEKIKNWFYDVKKHMNINALKSKPE